ncbi:MAG: YggT family protein [Candidatus Paceibacterota bacterium]
MTTRIVLLRLINIIIGLVLIFLGLRLVLKLLGANPNAGFVAWIYGMTEPLLVPFQGMFPTPVVEANFILEFSTLFAILIYAIIGWLLMELVDFIVDATNERTVERR